MLGFSLSHTDVRLAMRKILFFVLLSTSVSVAAQLSYGHWPYLGYQSAVTASGIWSYHPKALSILRTSARPDEPCSSKTPYSLRSLPFEVTCGHRDELNHRPWGLGDIEDIRSTTFKDAFHMP